MFVARTRAVLTRRLNVRQSSAWLQGRPPRVNTEAGTVAAFYYKNVREFDIPTKDFFIATQQNEKLNIGQFDDNVYAYAVGLLDGLGLKKGHKVALWMTNEAELPVLQYACALAGATTVLLDPSLTFEGVKSVLEQEPGVRVLILSHRVGKEVRTDGVKAPAAFGPELQAYEHEWGHFPIQSKRFRDLKFIVSTGTEEPPEGVMRLKDCLVRGGVDGYEFDEIAAVQMAVENKDAATVHYGPASGDANAASRQRSYVHSDLLSTANASAKAMGLTGADTVAVTAPMHTHFGFAAGVAAASSARARILVPSRVFDASLALRAMSKQRATAVVATAEQLKALEEAYKADQAKPAEKRDYDLSSLQKGIIAGDGSAVPKTFASATLKTVDAAKLPSPQAFQ